MNRGKLSSWTIIRDRVDHLISARIRRCVARLGFQVALPRSGLRGRLMLVVSGGSGTPGHHAIPWVGGRRVGGP